MNLREAAQQALDFIVALNKSSQFWLVPASNLNKTVTALRAALAEEAMQRLTDVQQEIEKTHTSVDNEYTPVKPVAWRTKNATPPGGYVVFQQYPSAVANLGGEIEPLYTTLPQRKPLTKESLLYIYNQLPNWGMDMDRLPQGLEKFARAVEAAHGIGGEE